MARIKVVMHAKTIGYSGTDRACQLFAKYIDKSRFEPFVLYREGDHANTRINTVKDWLGQDHVLPYVWRPGKRGRTPPYLPEEDNFADVLNTIKPDIVHCHYSGYNEWPAFKYLYPGAKWIGHNIFAFKEDKSEMDLVIYIADYVRDMALSKGGKDGPVLYNPIEQPILDVTFKNKEFCRNTIIENFKIPRNSVILGRVGRADNFDPISLRAFAEVEKICPTAWYVVVNPCNRWKEEANKLGIQNIRFSDPIIDDVELSNFYRGLDIYAHARHDGEMCPTSIQEAMMHRLPVVSHESAIYNGQSEIIGNAGFVVPVGDHIAYRDVLIELINNPEMVNEDDTGMIRLRDHFGLEARRRAMRCFEAKCITRRLEKMYDWVLAR